MNNFEIIENFEKHFPNFPKNKVWEKKYSNGEVSLNFAIKTGEGLMILLRLIIGKRGGIREDIIVIDPGQKIAIDRLVFEDVSTSNAHILSLEKMRQNKSIKKDFLKNEMTKKLKEIISKPYYFNKSFFKSRTKNETRQIRTVSGGIPGTGKKR